MSKLKLAIIGIGHLGSAHLKNISELSERVEIAGICDVKAERTQRLASHYNVPFLSDFRQLEAKVDAVDICVPTQDHLKVGRFFLSQGIHTFIEKPISRTLEEADELNELAVKNNAILQVGHIERFNSAFQSVAHFCKDPVFIECHRLNKFPHRSLDIGVVMDLMIHDIDIILGLINSPMIDLQAVGIPVLTALEDIANVRMTFANGCVCNLTASRVSEDVTRKIRIFQQDTYISLDYVQQEAFIYKKHSGQILKHALPIEKEQPLKRELEHFLDCIENNQKPLVSGVEAREALRVALEISDCIWKQPSYTGVTVGDRG